MAQVLEAICIKSHKSLLLTSRLKYLEIFTVHYSVLFIVSRREI